MIVLKLGVNMLFCCGLFFLGRLMRRSPERCLRVFMFGQKSQLDLKWPIASVRLMGLFFMFTPVLLIVLLSVLIAVYFLLGVGIR